MYIAIINGPNLNLLGLREAEIYGNMTYQELLMELTEYADSLGIELKFFQSNHEGALIDFIQSCPGQYNGIIINAGAYTHTSIALLDALSAVALPTVEVHLSNIEEREEFRRRSYLRQACLTTFMGEGLASYQKALHFLSEVLTNDTATKTSTE